MANAEDQADAAILTQAVADRGIWNSYTAADIDLGVILPALSEAGRAWYMLSTPDHVLRTALNCWWAAAPQDERHQRRAEARAIYHGHGAALRARIIAAQNKARALTCQEKGNA